MVIQSVQLHGSAVAQGSTERFGSSLSAYLRSLISFGAESSNHAGIMVAERSGVLCGFFDIGGRF